MTRSDRRTFLANGLRTGALSLVGGIAGSVVGDSALAPSPAGAAPLEVAGRPGALNGLTVNGMARALGVDPDDLFFAWKLADRRRGARQSAYRLRVARSSAPSGSGAVWDSGEVASPRQAFVAYSGPPLAPDTAYRWEVSVADDAGVWGRTAGNALFVTGLRGGDWKGLWLRPGPATPAAEEYSYLRTVVRVGASPVVRATAYVAAAHKYQLWMNGVLADTGPSFSYPDESYYQATDVTAHVRAGRRNALGILHHWYGRGSGRPASAPGLLVQVTVHHADGTREVFASDASWRQLPGEWRPAPQRNGSSGEFVEIIDGRQHPVGWSQADYEDAGWTTPGVWGPVGTAPFTGLYPQRTRIVEHAVEPASVRTLASGAVVVDFGKVYAARPSVEFHHGVAGRSIPMHVGYLLDPDGHVSTIHGTQGTDLSFGYVQRDGHQKFVPYTFLGFRYLEVGSPGETLSAPQLRAIVRHAQMPRSSAVDFSSSDAELNAVWALCTHSCLYASHEQFVDTPTRQKGQFCSDSTNESQAVMGAYDDQNMTWQALRDFARSQARFWPDGRINDVYPDGNGATDIPDFTELYPEWVWRYYARTGDRVTLAILYPVAQRIAEYIWRAVDPSSGLVTRLPGGGTDYTYGLVDWPPQMRYGYDMNTAARTTVNILGVNALRRVAQMGTILGDRGAAAVQQSRSDALVAAVNGRLIGPAGVYIDGLEPDASQSTHASQQANALALAYDVVPAHRRRAVGAHVASLQVAMGPDHGMELLRGLHAAGLDAHMVSVLTDPNHPGWARILRAGGTFTWEDWEPSDLLGDSMSHGWGSSALVAVQEALLGVQVSASPEASDTVVLDVTPPSGGVDAVRGGLMTVAGPVSVAWRRSGSRPTLALELTVPANATARVHLPAPDPASVTEGGRPVGETPGAQGVTSGDGTVTVALGAGAYAFTVS